MQGRLGLVCLLFWAKRQLLDPQPLIRGKLCVSLGAGAALVCSEGGGSVVNKPARGEGNPNQLWDYKSALAICLYKD